MSIVCTAANRAAQNNSVECRQDPEINRYAGETAVLRCMRRSLREVAAEATKASQSSRQTTELRY
jgi:hypothetical protein